MSKIDIELMYMNPVSGRVQSGGEWYDDYKHNGFPESDLYKLIEVEWNSFHQQWMEA